MVFSLIKKLFCPGCIAFGTMSFLMPILTTFAIYKTYARFRMMREWQKITAERQLTFTIEPEELAGAINEACRRLKKHGERIPELEAHSGRISARIGFDFNQVHVENITS
jgi:hypothetical protein